MNINQTQTLAYQHDLCLLAYNSDASLLLGRLAVAIESLRRQFMAVRWSSRPIQRSLYSAITHFHLKQSRDRLFATSCTVYSPFPNDIALYPNPHKPNTLSFIEMDLSRTNSKHKSTIHLYITKTRKQVTRPSSNETTVVYLSPFAP